MFFNLKTLASALLLSTAVVGSAEHLAKRAQPKGIDVSSNQGNINWKTVAANGVSFAYIKATEGTGTPGGVPVVLSTDTYGLRLQEPFLLLPVHRRHQRRPHSW